MSILSGLIGTWPGRALIGALAAVVVGAPILVGRITAAPAAAEARTAPVARGSVTQAVAVSGSVNAGGTARLNFQAAGRVAEILVKVGDRITAGQVLARLDTASLEASLAQAQANLASAQARYEQTAAGALPEDVASARLSVDNAQRSLDQARRTSDSDVATAKQNLAKLVSTYQTARSNFTWLGTQARADAIQLTRNLEQFQREYNDTLIVANSLSTSSDLRSAQTSLGNAVAALATAVSLSGTLLNEVLNEQANASSGVVGASNAYDAALASGGDTTGALAAYQSTLLVYSTAATRLTSAIDVVTGQLGSPQSAIASAQSALNSTAARAVPEYNSLRDGLRVLTDRIITAQQLAATVKSRLSQATTTLSPVTDAVTSGLASATQAIPTAHEKGASAIANFESSLASAQASFSKTTASPKSADVASAYASVISAKVSVDTAQNNLVNATLRAPTAGVIATLTGQAGEVATGTATNPFVSIANVTTLALHGTIGEGDVAKLRFGQVATVTVDAVGAGSRMTGKLTLIDPVATIQQGVPVYGVDVTIDVPDPLVRPGMSGTANVILASRTNVLTVPNLAIRTTGGRRGVQVMRDGKAVDAEVVFGIATDAVTEVVSGLEEGDLVVLPQARTTTPAQQQRQTVPGVGGGGVQFR